MTDRIREREKWDSIAQTCAISGSEAQLEVARKLAALLKSLKPKVSRVLEAGCGAGFTSLFLGIEGFDVDLLDISERMLEKAKDAFDGRRDYPALKPNFFCANLMETSLQTLSTQAYDCVFNIGLLEHYEESEIINLLRAMARLSKAYVVAMVPNSRCAVYRWWMWQRTRSGSWPYGKEVPRSTLLDLFPRAGLEPVIEIPVGYLATLEIAKELDDHANLISWLTSDDLPEEVSCYLICSVGHKPARTGSLRRTRSDTQELLARFQLHSLHELHSEQHRLNLALQQEIELRANSEKRASELEAYRDAMAPEMRLQILKLQENLRRQEVHLNETRAALLHEEELRCRAQADREQASHELGKAVSARENAERLVRALQEEHAQERQRFQAQSEQSQQEARATLAAVRAESAARIRMAAEKLEKKERELQQALSEQQQLSKSLGEITEKLQDERQFRSDAESEFRAYRQRLEPQYFDLQKQLAITRAELERISSEARSLKESLDAALASCTKIGHEFRSRERALRFDLDNARRSSHETGLALYMIENSWGYRALGKLKRLRDKLLFLSATHQLRPTLNTLLEALLCWPWRVILPGRIRAVLDARITDPEFYHHSLKVFCCDVSKWKARGYEAVNITASPSRTVRVSLIATVFNESGNARQWMQSIACQTRLPDELIVVDGGSSDSTVAIIREEGSKLACAFRIFEVLGCNIAGGRNIAIKNARFEYVAVTDAGCALKADWLESIVAPFEHDATVDAVIGWFELHPQSSSWNNNNSWLFVPRLENIDPKSILASSRSFAFRKSLGLILGGYPTHLTKWAEDTLFCLNLTGIGARWAFAPDAKAYWMGPASWMQFLRLRRNYQLGNGEARIYLGSGGIAIREALTAGTLIALAVGCIIAAFYWPPFLWLGLGSGGVFLRYISHSKQTQNVLKIKGWRAPGGFFPGPLLKGWLTCLADSVGMMQGLWRSRGIVLRRLLDLRVDTVVFLKSHEWFWMKQRIVQLAEAFARRGFQVVFCPNNNVQRIHGGLWRVNERIILCNDHACLWKLRRPIVYSAAASHFTRRRSFMPQRARIIFDLIDEVGATGSTDTDVITAARRSILTIAASTRLADYLRGQGCTGTAASIQRGELR